jgi:hypothetical protein
MIVSRRSAGTGTSAVLSLVDRPRRDAPDAVDGPLLAVTNAPLLKIE